VLNAKLAEIVEEIQVEPDIAEWITEALKSSYNDERQYRESEAKKLKHRYNDLQTRLDKAYEDRLDGIIDEHYWSVAATKWRNEQNQVRDQMNRFERADRSYVDEGTRILELAQHAYALYVTQEPSEKRKLLNHVLSNCTFDGATLYPIYRKPFDLTVEGIKTQRKYPRQDSNLLPSA
jgi:site-specific DNA recombinase